MTELSTFAGSVHDINNLLQIARDRLREARAPAPSESAVADSLILAENALSKATALCSRTIAGDALAPRRPESVDLSDVTKLCNRLLVSELWEPILFQPTRSGERVLAWCDPLAIEQALINLLLNAIQASPPGSQIQVAVGRCRPEELSGRGHFSTSLPDGEMFAELLVEDRGAGISEEHLTRVFEPRFTTRPTGRGLGLSSSRQLIEANGGALHVESSTERGRSGSTFRILLPLSRASKPPAPPSSNATAEESKTDSASVLVVDDEREIARSIARMLSMRGFSVETEDDGKGALRRLGAEPTPDAVLLDLSMPGLDGRETLLRIRRDHPGVKVALMTGAAEPTLRARLNGECVDAVLFKPFGPEELHAVLDHLLRSAPDSDGPGVD